MRTKEHVGFVLKCPLLSSEFNQNWKVQIRFRKTPQYVSLQNQFSVSRVVCI